MRKHSGKKSWSSALRLLSLQSRTNIQGLAERLGSEMGIFCYLVSAAASLRRFKHKVGLSRCFGWNGDFLLEHYSNAGMPGHERVLAWRDVGERIIAVRPGQLVIGMFDRKPPTFHIGVKAALHDKELSPLRHMDPL